MKKRLIPPLSLLLLLLVSACTQKGVLAENLLESPSPMPATATAQQTEVKPVVTATPATMVTGTSTPLELATTESIATLTPTQVPTMPEEYYIQGVRGHKQYFPLGCEASVAVDWAAFFGIEINEFEFQNSLPLSDNPDLGFVGSVEGPWGQVPPYAYGVHAAPVAELLQDYGVNAVGLKGYTLEALKRQIVSDQPVIAWVIGNVVGGIPYNYVDSQGNLSIVAAYEHVIIVTGYNQERIRYNNNGKFYEIPIDVFENSWSVLGNMVVIMKEK